MLELNISTILLQMANFFILAFILYRFLFKPLQNILQKRENETTRVMDEAQTAKAEAEALRRQYEEKSNNIDSEISARKNEARIIIEQSRQQMLHEVQEEIEHLQAQTAETLAKLRSEAIQNHKEKLGNLASEFARGILSDVMTPEIQQTYQNLFLKLIDTIDLADYLEDIPPGEAAFIRVIVPHSPADPFKKDLSAVLQAHLSQEFNLTYEVNPGLLAGGVLRFENKLIDGSLQGQIQDFQKRYQEIV